MDKNIHFTVYFENKTYVIETYPFEYRSLMALLYDKIYIDEDFGECKGMGRCGTCVIHVLKQNNKITFWIEMNQKHSKR